jgi:hypothetical protein
VTDRDLLHTPAELPGQAVGAPQIARVEVVLAGGLNDCDRPKARAQQVNPTDTCVRADVEHQVLLDRLPSVGIVKTEAVGDGRSALDLPGARGLYLERVGAAEPTREPANGRVGVRLGHELVRDEHPEPNIVGEERPRRREVPRCQGIEKGRSHLVRFHHPWRTG